MDIKNLLSNTHWEALPGLVDHDGKPLSLSLLSQWNGDSDVILPHSINVGVDTGVPLFLGLTHGVDGAVGQPQTEGQD